MERKPNESFDDYKKRRANFNYQNRPRRYKFYQEGGTYVREKEEKTGFEKTELVPVKGTNQMVLVTTLTRYPNEQTIAMDIQIPFER